MDEVGLDYFGLGEHHRDDYAVSAPEIILAAASIETKKMVQAILNDEVVLWSENDTHDNVKQ